MSQQHPIVAVTGSSGAGTTTVKTAFEHIYRRLLADLGVRHFFDVIQGSGSGLPTKPHPAGLIAALHRLGVSAEQALYVGDSQTDV